MVLRIRTINTESAESKAGGSPGTCPSLAWSTEPRGHHFGGLGESRARGRDYRGLALSAIFFGWQTERSS